MTLIAQEVCLSWQTHLKTILVPRLKWLISCEGFVAKCLPSPTQKRKHVLLQVGYCLQELHRDASEQQVELAWTTFSISTKMRDVKGGNINSRFLGPNCALSPCGCKLGRSGPCSCVKDSADGEWTSKNLKFNIETSNHIFENARQSLELLPLLPREMLDC